MNINNPSLVTPKDWFSAAESYLAIGWSLIPIGDNKRPLGKWRQYQQEAAGMAQVEQWSKHPKLCGWAVVTGKVSNLVILDLDNGSAFDTSTLPFTVQSKTGSGGSHYFFLYPTNVAVKNTTGLIDKTDVRGQGGYAILPPSLHPSRVRHNSQQRASNRAPARFGSGRIQATAASSLPLDRGT